VYIFHVLRSFLPLRNPIGFGVSDFIELAIALLLLGLLFGWAWTRGWFERLKQHTLWCMVLIGALPVALRLLLLRHCPVPIAAGADDFGYVLLGDTLAHFRLSNPPHPLHQFFESVFVLQNPTYSSIYPLGQGIVLAFGKLVFGSFWAGVLISSGAFCASCYWMMRGWMSPGWAFVGGLIGLMQFGPLCQWTNTYWGGAVSATAGCLAVGALPRLRTGGLRTAMVLGLGFAVQWLTRPFEFVLLVVAVGMYVVWIGRRDLTLKRAAIVVAFVGAALLFSGVQNKAATGSWTTLPYMLSRYQYGVPSTFTFQAHPVPHRLLTREQELDYRAQVSVHDAAGGFAERLGYRVRFYRFFLFAPLYVSFIVFVLMARTRREWWVVASILVFAIGTNVYPYFFPHYVAAVACLFVFAAVRGLEEIERWNGWVPRLILLMCGAQFVFWYGLHLIAGENLWGAFRYEPVDFINYGDPEGRIAIEDQLVRAPGEQLVFVRYGPAHGFQEWIHNGADIDGSRVVWALDLGNRENETLLRYYPHRQAWLLQPDTKPPLLSAYPR
jgi:hypothetical protein